MKIAIDFDGTVVTHDYPNMGKDIGAIPILKELINNGHKLILYTMRCTDLLNDAIKWFENNNISLYSIQKDLYQETWTSSNKCYAQLYIDDAALGCPLLYDSESSERPFVDWKKVRDLLVVKDIIKNNI